MLIKFLFIFVVGWLIGWIQGMAHWQYFFTGKANSMVNLLCWTVFFLFVGLGIVLWVGGGG